MVQLDRREGEVRGQVHRSYVFLKAMDLRNFQQKTIWALILGEVVCGKVSIQGAIRSRDVTMARFQKSTGVSSMANIQNTSCIFEKKRERERESSPFTLSLLAKFAIFFKT